MTDDLRAWQSIGSHRTEPVLSLWRGLIEPSSTPFIVPKVADVQRVVADYYKIPVLEMQSEHRARKVARPRQVAMWLCKQLTTRSLPDIGNRFGFRDHTTVLHAVRRIEALRREDPKIAQDCQALLEHLRGVAA
jgi:chromosomal replication initiation ATPase DnaA